MIHRPNADGKRRLPSASRDAARGLGETVAEGRTLRDPGIFTAANSDACDADVIAWLKKRDKGYQTRVNSILRQTMLADAKRA